MEKDHHLHSGEDRVHTRARGVQLNTLLYLVRHKSSLVTTIVVPLLDEMETTQFFS